MCCFLALLDSHCQAKRQLEALSTVLRTTGPLTAQDPQLPSNLPDLQRAAIIDVIQAGVWTAPAIAVLPSPFADNVKLLSVGHEVKYTELLTVCKKLAGVNPLMRTSTAGGGRMAQVLRYKLIRRSMCVSLL